METTGFTRGLDSFESVKKPPFSIVEKIQQKGSIFSVESGSVIEV